MTTEHINTVGPKERFTPETLAKLDAPLNDARIARDPRGNNYLEGWDVIAAANAYFGFDGWNSETLSVGVVYSRIVMRHDDRRGEYQVEVSLYEAKVAIEAGGVRKVDVGTAITANDTVEAHETAVKGAVTDGLKRAMRQFGAQFGNDLYDKQRGGYVESEEPASRAPRPKVEQRSAPDPQPQTGPLTNVGWFYTKCWNDMRLSKREVLALHGAKDDAELEAAMQPFESWDAFFDKTAEMHAKAVPA